MKNSHLEIKKIWGFETWISNSPLYCGKILTINPGFRCSLHYHRLKTETFLVTSGVVLLELAAHVDDWKVLSFTSMFLLPGQSYTLLPGQLHRFSSLEGATVIEFSTQHFDYDSYRLEESGPIPPGEVV
jgi:D-lyxose ketol-isomerase